jgi:hypothetical protein
MVRVRVLLVVLWVALLKVRMLVVVARRGEDARGSLFVSCVLEGEHNELECGRAPLGGEIHGGATLSTQHVVVRRAGEDDDDGRHRRGLPVRRRARAHEDAVCMVRPCAFGSVYPPALKETFPGVRATFITLCRRL